MKRKYNCLELFAGSGGLGTGFANSGFNIISANDYGMAHLYIDVKAVRVHDE